MRGNMQHIQSINTAFYTAVRWNTIGYVVHRIFHTGTSVYLYYTLSSTDYVAWNVLLSIIFISIFFCDAGLRKSVPLYIDTYDMHRWLIPLYSAIAVILSVAIIGLSTWIIPYHAQHAVSYLVIPFVVIHTILIGMRLLYNAKLCNKRFAFIHSIWAGVECICIFVGLHYYGTQPIHTLFIAKIIGGFGALVHAWMRAPTPEHHKDDHSDMAHMKRHTGFVWLIAIARSLSERHVIMPIIAWTAPASIAATYKVLHDTVMLLYRTIIKAIDINDITVLRPLQTRRHAFFRISITMINWVSISIIALSFVPYIMTTASVHRSMFILLLMLTLLELPMIPWERICEIRRQYMMPLGAYAIALVVPVCFLACHVSNLPTYQHVMILLCTIHGIRTGMLWILGITAPREDHIQYPWRYATCILTCAIICGSMCIYSAP